jgi:hypothetical protein
MKNAFAYFYPTLKELLQKDRRRLFVKEGRLLSYLLLPQQGDLYEIDWGHYPAIEALAFAVLELERLNESRPRHTHVKNDYQHI